MRESNLWLFIVCLIAFFFLTRTCSYNWGLCSLNMLNRSGLEGFTTAGIHSSQTQKHWMPENIQQETGPLLSFYAIMTPDKNQVSPNQSINNSIPPGPPLGSYEQVTNNIPTWKRETPEDGSCQRAEMCGAMYSLPLSQYEQNNSSEITNALFSPLMEDIDSVRVGSFYNDSMKAPTKRISA